LRLPLHDGATLRSGPDLRKLLEQLRFGGIRVAGGGHIGDQDCILIDRVDDVEQAIAILAKLGIVAERG